MWNLYSMLGCIWTLWEVDIPQSWQQLHAHMLRYRAIIAEGATTMQTGKSYTTKWKNNSMYAREPGPIGGHWPENKRQHYACKFNKLRRLECNYNAYPKKTQLYVHRHESCPKAWSTQKQNKLCHVSSIKHKPDRICAPTCVTGKGLMRKHGHMQFQSKQCIMPNHALECGIAPTNLTWCAQTWVTLEQANTQTQATDKQNKSVNKWQQAQNWPDMCTDIGHGTEFVAFARKFKTDAKHGRQAYTHAAVKPNYQKSGNHMTAPYSNQWEKHKPNKSASHEPLTTSRQTTKNTSNGETDLQQGKPQLRLTTATNVATCKVKQETNNRSGYCQQNGTQQHFGATDQSEGTAQEWKIRLSGAHWSGRSHFGAEDPS